MRNREIATIFDRIADALELRGEEVFRVNAYRRAARIVRDLVDEIEKVASEGRLREIPGIGEGTARKIEEYLDTGRMAKYEEATRGIDGELLDMLGIQGVGPKTLKQAYESLGVKSLDDLKRVVGDGSLAELPRMGEKKVANIRKGLELFEKGRGRIPLGIALPIAERILEAMSGHGDLKSISTAGSLRRMVETIGDIDILATGSKGSEIISAFAGLPFVTRVLALGGTKGSVMIDGDTQVDMRVVKTSEYGAALQYFTGSKEHNVKLRGMARDKGLKLSEYGVFRGDRKIAGKTEEDVYKALGLPLIPPELREDRGEVEASLTGKLPDLVREDDVLGDLHVHSNYSDGSDSIEELATAAKGSGLSYIAICDHSRSAQYAGGLDAGTLYKQMKEIDRLNRRLENFRILKGSEVDILKDGSLDFEDDILEKLDVVVASIHSGFKQNVTERMIRAMQNPHVKIIGHPTGRLISRREGYEVDLEKVMRAASETGTALEINAYFDRLDLNDVNVRRAKELGVRLAIGTDSHSKETLWYRELGVSVARRGWLTKGDLLNCLPLKDLLSQKK